MVEDPHSLTPAETEDSKNILASGDLSNLYPAVLPVIGDPTPYAVHRAFNLLASKYIEATLPSLLICIPPTRVEQPNQFILDAQARFGGRGEAMMLARKKVEDFEHFTGIEEAKLRAYWLFPRANEPTSGDLGHREGFRLAFRKFLDDDDRKKLLDGDLRLLGERGRRPLNDAEEMLLTVLTANVLLERKAAMGSLDPKEQEELNRCVGLILDRKTWSPKLVDEDQRYIRRQLDEAYHAIIKDRVLNLRINHDAIVDFLRANPRNGVLGKGGKIVEQPELVTQGQALSREQLLFYMLLDRAGWSGQSHHNQERGINDLITNLQQNPRSGEGGSADPAKPIIVREGHVTPPPPEKLWGDTIGEWLKYVVVGVPLTWTALDVVASFATRRPFPITTNFWRWVGSHAPDAGSWLLNRWNSERPMRNSLAQAMEHVRQVVPQEHLNRRPPTGARPAAAGTAQTAWDAAAAEARRSYQEVGRVLTDYAAANQMDVVARTRLRDRAAEFTRIGTDPAVPIPNESPLQNLQRALAPQTARTSARAEQRALTTVMQQVERTAAGTELGDHLSRRPPAGTRPTTAGTAQTAWDAAAAEARRSYQEVGRTLEASLQDPANSNMDANARTIIETAAREYHEIGTGARDLPGETPRQNLARRCTVVVPPARVANHYAAALDRLDRLAEGAEGTELRNNLNRRPSGPEVARPGAEPPQPGAEPAAGDPARPAWEAARDARQTWEAARDARQAWETANTEARRSYGEVGRQLTEFLRDPVASRGIDSVARGRIQYLARQYADIADGTRDIPNETPSQNLERSWHAFMPTTRAEARALSNLHRQLELIAEGSALEGHLNAGPPQGREPPRSGTEPVVGDPARQAWEAARDARQTWERQNAEARAGYGEIGRQLEYLLRDPENAGIDANARRRLRRLAGEYAEISRGERALPDMSPGQHLDRECTPPARTGWRRFSPFVATLGLAGGEAMRVDAAAPHQSPPARVATLEADHPQVNRFWERAREQVRDLPEIARRAISENPEARVNVLEAAKRALASEGPINADAEVAIDRAIQEARTNNIPPQLRAILSVEGAPARAGGRAPTVIRTEVRMRLRDVSDVGVRLEQGQGARVELTVAGASYRIEDEKVLDKLKDKYAERVAELKAMTSRTEEQQAELTRLEKARETGWGAERLEARAAFVQKEIAEGRMRFEFKPGQRGGPGVGTFVGVGIILTAVGAVLISEAPQRQSDPTRSERVY